MADFLTLGATLTEPKADPAAPFFAAAGPAFSFPSSSFLAAIKLILALLAAVSLGSTELTLPPPAPPAPAPVVFGTGLALNSVLFLAASAWASSSFFSRSSRAAFIFAAMASPGRVKLDLVGGLPDLVGTKPGLEVESFLPVVRLVAVVDGGGGAAAAGCVGLLVAVEVVSGVDESGLEALSVEDWG
jgi:hypothetical protein